MGLCRFADMQSCGGYAPSRGFVVFTPYAGRRRVLFHGFFHTLCHYAYGSLRIVEAQVLWIPEDHGMVLDCWRLGFIRRIGFLRVRLVSGVLGWFDGDIYLLACP